MRDAIGALRLLGEALAAIASARRALRRDPSCVAPLLASAPRPTGDRERATARAVGQAVLRASRLARRSTCLVRALAAHRMLARRGVHATLRLGREASDANGFFAHAWLELDATPCFGEPSPHVFRPTRGAEQY